MCKRVRPVGVKAGSDDQQVWFESADRRSDDSLKGSGVGAHTGAWRQRDVHITAAPGAFPTSSTLPESAG